MVVLSCLVLSYLISHVFRFDYPIFWLTVWWYRQDNTALDMSKLMEGPIPVLSCVVLPCLLSYFYLVWYCLGLTWLVVPCDSVVVSSVVLSKLALSLSFYPFTLLPFYPFTLLYLYPFILLSFYPFTLLP